MLKVISTAIFALCCLSVVSILFFTPTYIHTITVDSEGWGSKFFGLFAVPTIAANLFLLITSIFLYRKGRHRLDLASVCSSGIVLGIVVLAWVLVEPLRLWIIFGR